MRMKLCHGSTIVFLLFGMLTTSVSSSALCAYRNVRVNNDTGVGDDEVIGTLQPDEESVLCGKNENWCYAFWYTRPGSDEIIISKQGCWTYEARPHDCNQPTCNTVEPPITSIQRAHNISSQFCCCLGDYCNINMTSSYVPGAITEPALFQVPIDIVTLSPPRDESWTTIIIVMACILCLCIFIPVLVLLLSMYRVRSLKTNKEQLGMVEAAPPEPTVNLDHLTILNLVGQGRYCNCYRGVLEETEVAVKIFAGASRQCYKNEVELYGLAHMEHPNVLKFIGRTERKGADDWPEYLLVVEYMAYGSLMNYMKTNTYDWLGMCKLAQTAAAGLAHLHQAVDRAGKKRAAIVHRDINSRNILVKADLTSVIGDFGFAMKVFGSSVVRDGDEDNSTITDVGTVRYMSPEVLDGAVNLRDCEFALKQVDIYALGLVLWEVGTRCSDLYPGGEVPPYRLPFADELCQHPTFEDMQVHVSRDRKRPAFPDAWKENNQALRSFKETIEDCWDHDSEARLTSLCVEERIIELRALWDKHPTVTPTINSTSEGPAPDSFTQLLPRLVAPMIPMIIDTTPRITDESPRGIPMIEKNERQRLLSPIGTTLSAQSDLNLIDLSAIAPAVDPKNLHHSDESIERFTSDLKFGVGESTAESSAEYGYSEPTTSPSQPLVMNEMRPSRGGTQMTDNLGAWSRRQNIHRPTTLPMWGQMTVNEARARSNHNDPGVKPDVNKQREQSWAADQQEAFGSDSSSSRGSCSSLESTSSDGSGYLNRPNTLPLNSNGPMKKLVVVYIPDAGPTTKVQTGIAKMIEDRRQPVRVTRNFTHCRNDITSPPKTAGPKEPRPQSWSAGDKTDDESDSTNSHNENSKSRDCDLDTVAAKKTKRRVTPYRISGSKQLSVYKSDSSSSSMTSDDPTPTEHAAVNGHQCNGNKRHGGNECMVSNGNALPPSDSSFQLGIDNDVSWSEEKKAKVNYQVSCV